MTKFSISSEKKSKKRLKGVLNTCKTILKNAHNNGCVVKNIDKAISAIK